MYKYDLNNTYTKIYYKSSSEFEEIRSICLKDNNWLSHNYTKENLVIEDHNGYAVAFQKITDKPIIMAGVYNNGRFPKNIARMVNRLYTFPEFRTTRSDMVDGFKLAHERIIFPLIEINNFDCYFITMQNRSKNTKGWWKIWKEAMQKSSENFWVESQGYIQTCPWNVKKCWQNFIYKDMTKGTFEEWNTKILNDQEWESLPEGS